MYVSFDIFQKFYNEVYGMTSRAPFHSKVDRREQKPIDSAQMILIVLGFRLTISSCFLFEYLVCHNHVMFAFYFSIESFAFRICLSLHWSELLNSLTRLDDLID